MHLHVHTYTYVGTVLYRAESNDRYLLTYPRHISGGVENVGTYIPHRVHPVPPPPPPFHLPPARDSKIGSISIRYISPAQLGLCIRARVCRVGHTYVLCTYECTLLLWAYIRYIEHNIPTRTYIHIYCTLEDTSILSLTYITYLPTYLPIYMYYVLHCVWLGKGAGVAWIDSQTRYVCVCVCVCVAGGEMWVIARWMHFDGKSRRIKTESANQIARTSERYTLSMQTTVL